MYRSAVQYHGTWLAPGSKALDLYEAKKIKELDAHIKAVNEKDRKFSPVTITTKVIPDA